MLRIAEGRQEKPAAVIFDSRTLQSSVESGAKAGYDGAKHRKGNKVHAAVDSFWHLLALCVTPANEQDRDQVAELAKGYKPRLAKRSRSPMLIIGYTCENAADGAQGHGIELEVAKLPKAKRGLVLFPRRLVIERSFGWVSRFRRLARDYERFLETLAGLQFVAFVILKLKNVADVLI